jgi:hypothetical protein
VVVDTVAADLVVVAMAVAVLVDTAVAVAEDPVALEVQAVADPAAVEVQAAADPVVVAVLEEAEAAAVPDARAGIQTTRNHCSQSSPALPCTLNIRISLSTRNGSGPRPQCYAHINAESYSCQRTHHPLHDELRSTG